MRKEEAINQAREFVSESRIRQSLNMLDKYLAEEKSVSGAIKNRISQFKARYAELERKQQADIISEEQSRIVHNQIVNDVLDFLYQWENEVLSVGAVKRNRWLIPLGGVLLIGLVGLGSWWVLNLGQGISEENSLCNDLGLNFSENSAFNTMIAPFVPLGGETAVDLDVEEPIKKFLESLGLEYGVDISSRILKSEDDIQKYDDVDEKIALGNDCNVDLVIWGTTEIDEKDSTLITTHYKIIPKEENEEKSDQFFKLTKFVPTYGNEVTSVPVFTDIAKDGLTTRHIENIYRLVFGIVAIENGKENAALEVLSSIDSSSPADSIVEILKGMYEAEGLLAQDEDTLALLAYNRVVVGHPQYPLARINRGAKRFQKENYEGAAEDYLALIKMQPGNALGYAFLGFSYEKLGKYKEAIKYLEQANAHFIEDRKESVAVKDTALVEQVRETLNILKNR